MDGEAAGLPLAGCRARRGDVMGGLYASFRHFSTFPDHLRDTCSVGSPWANLGFLEQAGDEEVLKHSSGGVR